MASLGLARPCDIQISVISIITTKLSPLSSRFAHFSPMPRQFQCQEDVPTRTPQRLITHWGIHGNRCSWAESGVFGCASRKVADTSISDPLHTVSPNVTARCRGTHIRLVEGSLVVRSGSSPPDDAMAVCFLAWPELVLVNFGQVW